MLDGLARLLTTIGPAFAPVGSETLLTGITATAMEMFGAAACSLSLLSEDGAELVFRAASGAGASTVIGMRFPSSQGIAGWVITSEEPLEVRDLREDARFYRDFAESTGFVPNSILAAPVTSPSRQLGVLSVLDRDRDRHDAAHDMRLLQLFADQAALSIEGSRVFSNLGSAVLHAVAAAVPGTSLSDTLAAAAEESVDANADVLRVATLLAALDAAGDEERRLAVALLEQIVAYTGRRDRRRG